MRQLVLPGDRTGDRRFVLDEKTSRYLLRVLRMKRGDSFSAIDEAGNRFLCAIEDASQAAGVVALTPESGGAEIRPGTPRIALVQGLPKGPKMDLILRQAVEAGTEAVFPLQTRNCVVRERNEEDIADKLERRRKIVKEALQQSGSAVRTKVLPTASIDTLVGALSEEGYSPDGSLYLMFHELPLAEKSLHEYCAGALLPTVILIGPEGGFAPEETDAFRAMGFKPAHLEGAILRTETAALFAMAAVKTILMERTSWTLSK
ncbi:MAG TPA: RsmE family RNA methyltransferase [Rectinemataceae bacterium]|nr:RsmE family RNA methyltransferase [Rectinemataceae bacterium]